MRYLVHTQEVPLQDIAGLEHDVFGVPTDPVVTLQAPGPVQENLEFEHVYLVVGTHIRADSGSQFAAVGVIKGDPVHVAAEQPVWPEFTHLPLGHWLSALQTQAECAALQTPEEHVKPPAKQVFGKHWPVVAPTQA